MKIKGPKAAINRFLLFKSFFLVFETFFIGIFSGFLAAKSILLGGLVLIFPAVILVKKMFPKDIKNSPKEYLNLFYQGQALKWIFSIGLFSLVFTCCVINAKFFFLGFITIQMLVWFGAFWI